MIWILVSLFTLYNVEYFAYSLKEIQLVLIASLAIGVNEETVTRGILLIGLRNNDLAEWMAMLITPVVFSLLHILNLFGDGNISILLGVLTGGKLLYIGRRVFYNLFIPIGMHALYDRLVSVDRQVFGC